MAYTINLPRIVSNAMTFASSCPNDIPKPTVSATSNDNNVIDEIILEWENPRAIVSITDEATFAYTIYNGTTFIPGEVNGPTLDQFPQDLHNHLKPQTTYNEHWLHDRG